MSTLIPVILSGGSGTRLWPLSRRLHPKQFMDINGKTLFGTTLDRALALPKVSAPIIICNEEHRFLAASILQDKITQNNIQKNIENPQILLEPIGKNTAPAIALCAMAALDAIANIKDNDPILLILSSDHRIEPQEAFADAVSLAIIAAKQDKIIVFGVPPTNPETGYGYIKHGRPLDFEGSNLPEGFLKTDLHIDEVEQFLEKPSQEKAKAMLAEGGYSWNSGMFCARASVLLEELKKYAPDILKTCKEIWQSRHQDIDFTRFDAKIFSTCPSISIDYAIMEKTTSACVVPLLASWQDMGSWDAFYASSTKDAAGNAYVGDVVLQNTNNSYVHATHRMVAALDVKNLHIIETADAVLVMNREHGQDVKILLETFKKQGRPETDTHLRVHRPWGTYETLVLSERFQVKRIVVLPSKTLSLQLHHHRAEHWVVVKGTAKVTVDDKVVLLTEDMSTYIPLGIKHRLENPGLIPLEIIEIQSGPYLGEDDIVRFEDVYGRGSGGSLI